MIKRIKEILWGISQWIVVTFGAIGIILLYIVLAAGPMILIIWFAIWVVKKYFG